MRARAIEAAQQARALVAREVAVEQQRIAVEEAERARVEAEEELARQRREEERKLKETQKKLLQKERRRLKQITQEQNYFSDSPTEQLSRMEDVLKMCEVFSVDKLKSLNDHLETPNGVSPADCFVQHVAEVHQELEARSAELMEGSKSNKTDTAGLALSSWSTDENRVLIKAVTLFPPGTSSRWEVIATYVNEHRNKDATTKPKTDRDVIKQVKAIQKMEVSAKEAITTGGGQNKLGGGVLVEQQTVTNGASEQSTDPEKTVIAWSADEQKLFEQALKTYSSTTPDRWDRIAECVPGKTKKDCMRRFKELAELVKAKKAAQDKVAAK